MEEAIKILEQIEKEKWNDAVHCTCLGYAIALLKGEDEDSRETLEWLKLRIKPKRKKRK